MIWNVYSGVRNFIECTLLHSMLDKFFFIKSIEMRWHCLWNYWFYLLSLNLRSSLQFEILEVLLICSFALEFQRLILTHCDDWFSLSDWFQHVVMFSQFSLLLLSEILLVIRISFEWQRVEWVLRMFFMENIIVTILPIWETFLIKWLT